MSAATENQAARARRALRFASSVLCGALLLALTGVTLVDVVGRYLLNNPLYGGAEITQLLLMAVIFTGLPAVCLDDGHIVVDLLTGNLKGFAAAAQLFIARVLSAVVLGVIAWRFWEDAAHMFRKNDVSGEYLQFPIGYFGYGAAVIVGFSALITIAAALLGLSKGGDEK